MLATHVIYSFILFIVTKSQNNMGNSRTYTKTGSNNINEYCQDLMKDFFEFCEGRPEYINSMVWIKDIEKPMPPTPKQMGIMLGRLDVIWKTFCTDARFPRETRELFMKRVKERWMELGEKQKGIPVRKRKSVTENPQ